MNPKMTDQLDAGRAAYIYGLAKASNPNPNESDEWKIWNQGWDEAEAPELWRDIAAATKRQREIRTIYKTGKGEWYAVVKAYRTEDPIVETTVTTDYKKCKTQKEAIEAGRRLMAEKANLLSLETWIEVKICSELEWGPGKF